MHNNVNDKRNLRSRNKLESMAGYPAFCKKTNGASLKTDGSSVQKASKKIESDFLNLYPKSNCTASELQIGAIIGKALRLAFHDAAEFDYNTRDKLGPDGCLSGDAQNNGLIVNDSIVNTLFEPIWQNYCDKISRGDFWALIASIAVEHAEPTNTIKIPRKWGRIDAKTCSTDLRLPNAKEGLKDIERVFVHQLHFTMDEAGLYFLYFLSKIKILFV